jgi:tetratricopeptide (TPR) repeat protein
MSHKFILRFAQDSFQSQEHKKFKIFLLVSLCTCVLVTFSCPTYAALNLDQAKAYLMQGDYKSAIAEGEKLQAQNSRSAGSDELYYILGLSYLKDGNYLRASDIFEIILNEFKNSKFREEAKLGLGDTYFLRNDFSRAEALYKELLNSGLPASLKPVLYYRLSQVGFKSGHIEQGKEYADKLNQEYPLNLESKISEDLCFLPASPSGLFYTVQVGAFSNLANAKSLSQKLTRNSYPAYIEDAGLEGKTSFHVRVGKYRTRQEAESLEKKLAQEGYPTRICP